MLYSMLDTVVILFSLDVSRELPCTSSLVNAHREYQETQSALGNWSTHLAGAYSLLEACGGTEVWATSARVEVQVGLLTWYTNPPLPNWPEFSS